VDGWLVATEGAGPSVLAARPIWGLGLIPGRSGYGTKQPSPFRAST